MSFIGEDILMQIKAAAARDRAAKVMQLAEAEVAEHGHVNVITDYRLRKVDAEMLEIGVKRSLAAEGRMR